MHTDSQPQEARNEAAIRDCLADIALLGGGNSSEWVGDFRILAEVDPCRAFAHVCAFPWYDRLSSGARTQLWALLLACSDLSRPTLKGIRYLLEDHLEEDEMARVLSAAAARRVQLGMAA